MKLHADLVAAGRCATLASMSPSLVELLATVAGPRPAPDDLDIITEAGGETDAWVGPEDLDIITKATGETDAFGPEDLDVITRASGECDRWARAAADDPTPRPGDLDTVTLDDRESDVW